MAWELFGYSIVRKDDPTKDEDSKKSFVPKNNEDGSAIIASSGSMGAYVDLDGGLRSEAELVQRYRNIAQTAEVDRGVSEITNEAICVDERDVVKLDLDDLKDRVTDPVREAIQKAFDKVFSLLEFNEKGYYIFQRWYVDGRTNYHIVIDEKNPDKGIQELRYVDPRKIRRIREVEKKLVTDGGIQRFVVQTKAEYYMFNEGGFQGPTGTQTVVQGMGTSVAGIKVAIDSVASVNSGLTDETGNVVYGYLQKAIKPLNVLRAIEDASVIYRLARAAERRVWYIDVGNLPKAAADQYVKSVMDTQKSQFQYNAATGEITGGKNKFSTMLEDFYLARREGSRGTEVQTLPSSGTLGDNDDLLYFQKKLYEALGVPISRLQPGDAFTIGRATEITRDEVAFGKFITRLRTRFSGLFTQLLEKELVLTEVMSVEDFRYLSSRIKYTFANDNYFMEMKEAEVLQNRLELLEQISPWVGRYYSNEYVNHAVLRLNDEEIDEMREQIESEENDPIYSQPMPGQGNPMDQGMPPMGPEELPPDQDPDQFQDPGDGQGPPTQAAQQADNGGQDPEQDDQPKVQQRRDFRLKKRPQVAGKDK
jgi:hypothetical protein